MKIRNVVIELTKSQQDEIKATTKISLKSVVVGIDEEAKWLVFKGFIVSDSKNSDDGYLDKVKLSQPCMVYDDDN